MTSIEGMIELEDLTPLEEISLTKKQLKLLFSASRKPKPVECTDEDGALFFHYQLAKVSFRAPYSKRGKFDGKSHQISILPRGRKLRRLLAWRFVRKLIPWAFGIILASILENLVGMMF